MTDDEMNAEEREAMTDALYNIACGAGPTVNNELAIYALVDVLAVFVAGGTGGKPASNIDHVASAIGEVIADKAHQLRSARDEAAQ